MVEQYLPQVRATIWTVSKERSLYDPDTFETMALDYTIKTVLNLSDPNNVKREFGCYLEQRMGKQMGRWNKRQQKEKFRPVKLSMPAPRKDRSIEDVVADLGALLSDEDKEILIRVLYKRDDEQLKDVFIDENGDFDVTTRNIWYKRIQPTLKAHLEGDE